ncbi:phage portal protein [Wohlfahrtiimonas chitiniclastica]|uniref:phage portal protein n=1 Tax=Wohlfahrtiimonas chitiniclastica TaxID=400946 RepID=UPI001BCCE34E|nr:phage portal protein [Wohlfahrtiimonas chitiniclastica]MBS7829206.1 phage portal protein [Wohlfahrtiimonas chitiniclastica]
MKKQGLIKRTLLKMAGADQYADQRVQAALKIVTDSFGTSMSGQTVTLDKSMRVSTVWACVRLLSETISTMPLKVYEKKADGSRVEAKDSDLYRVLSIQPNLIQTPTKLLEFLVASLSIKGNAYFEKKMIGNRLINLHPILPQDIISIDLVNGKLQYKFMRNDKEQIRNSDQIWHIRGFGLDGMLGLDVFDVGRDAIGAAISSSEASSNFFKGGMTISGALTVDSILTDEQREEIKASLSKFTGSKNSGKLMVLEAGMKYQGISINPEQSQLLETRGYDVEEICRLFKVPPVLIGYMTKQSSWASSLEALNQQFLTYTLLPILRNIEESIAKCLVRPEDQGRLFVKFNYEGFLRADSAARSAYYTQAVSNGWMSRNEVREKEDLPKMEGGDTYTVQSAMIPLEKVGGNYE